MEIPITLIEGNLLDPNVPEERKELCRRALKVLEQVSPRHPDLVHVEFYLKALEN